MMKTKLSFLALLLAVALIACAAPQRQQQSAASGAAIGAGAGAIIGHQFGRGGRDTGALIGGLLGGATGLLYGQNQQALQGGNGGYGRQPSAPYNDDFRNPYQAPSPRYCNGHWQWDPVSAYWLCQ